MPVTHPEVSMHAPARRTAALAALPLAAVLLAACGDDSPSIAAGSASAASTSSATSTSSSSGMASSSAAPSTTASSASTSSAAAGATTRDPGSILRTSKASANGAKSTHVNGDVVDDGKKMNVDARGQVQGSNQEVTVKTQNEGTITIRSISNTHYVKGDRTYWTKQGAPSTTVSRLANKWVKAPADKSDSFSQFTIKKLLGDMTEGFDDSKITRLNTTVTGTTSGATKALKLAPRFSSDTTTITVVDDPKYLPLRIVSGDGTVTMSEWDSVPMYAAPPASQQVTIPGAA
ncbi:hypothetical protein PZ938_14060 [Luteipulveratus sp. YIM 133132]|uniref:hypothetical protein n=1 Tax=Luteipulveratus flavus TaxID=3031728 RepID=UPI0023AEC7D1|nr:hypothetical protein [Luteipulveratus sp. YIM 133132]MDE9366734.1 hypothetical protein [Luteipulveratus sp. YIM 133132]